MNPVVNTNSYVVIPVKFQICGQETVPIATLNDTVGLKLFQYRSYDGAKQVKATNISSLFGNSTNPSCPIIGFELVDFEQSAYKEGAVTKYGVSESYTNTFS